MVSLPVNQSVRTHPPRADSAHHSMRVTGVYAPTAGAVNGQE